MFWGLSYLRKNVPIKQPKIPIDPEWLIVIICMGYVSLNVSRRFAPQCTP